MIAGLRRAGAEVKVLAASNSPTFDGLEVLPILPTVDPLEEKLILKLIAAFPKAWAFLRGCDVIYSLIEPYAPLGAWLVGKRPLFITGHGSYVQIDRAYRRPVQLFYRRAFRRGTVICVSRYTAAQVALNDPTVRTVVITNGIDSERLANLPNITKDRRTVLSVGAIKPRKGTLQLVRAMRIVRDSMPEARCFIAGDTVADRNYTERVRAEINTLGLSDTVTLLGRVSDDDLRMWYARADVFALPSMNDGWRFEGFGLVLLEAAAAGLPVIGTRGCGAEDVIDHGVTGFLVPQDGVEPALATVILSLLRDPEQCEIIGSAGRAKAIAQTWGAVAVQMTALYAKV